MKSGSIVIVSILKIILEYCGVTTMAGELIPDPTKSPWVTVEVDGQTKTRCRYCLQFFTPPPAVRNGNDVSVESFIKSTHFKWCEWVEAYLEGS